MARRKRNLSIIGFLPAILVLGVITLVIKAVSQISAEAFGWIFFCILCVAAILLICQRNASRQVNDKIEGIIERHMAALVRRRVQLVQPDDYGTLQTAKWNKEIDKFLSETVAAELSPRELKRLNHTAARARIEEMSAKAMNKITAIADFSPQMSPREFELFCAERLRRAGWEAHVTKASGDQGADVIAEKNGYRIVLQCKLYSKPVGNHVVQQALSAKGHERAHFAAVVSNNTYTAPAKQLAGTTRIALLHFSDLDRVDEMIVGSV